MALDLMKLEHLQIEEWIDAIIQALKIMVVNGKENQDFILWYTRNLLLVYCRNLFLLTCITCMIVS